MGEFSCSYGMSVEFSILSNLNGTSPIAPSTIAAQGDAS